MWRKKRKPEGAMSERLRSVFETDEEMSSQISTMVSTVGMAGMGSSLSVLDTETALETERSEMEEGGSRGVRSVKKEHALKQELKRITKGGYAQIEKDAKSIMSLYPTFHHFTRSARNNRYRNVILYDHSRVKLTDNLGNNYIHASYVDGFQTTHGYILTQGPLEETIGDLWRMVWQTKSPVIVLLNSPLDNDNLPYYAPFWPNQLENTKTVAKNAFRITIEKYCITPDHECYDILLELLRPTSHDKVHRLQLMHYRKWLDDLEPPTGLSKFIARCRVSYMQQWGRNRKDKNSNNAYKPPMIVMCSTGVTRSGTYVCLEICQMRLLKRGTVDISETAKRVRCQRYGTLHKTPHHLFLYESMVDFAIGLNFLPKNVIDLGNLSKDMCVKRSLKQ